MVPSSLNEDLYFNLDRATLLMRRHVIDVIGMHHVSPEQWEVLQFVDNQVGVSQAQLTQLTLKDKGNVSRILSRMINNGWLHRQPQDSGRGFIITLTNHGRQIKQNLPRIVNKQVSRILEPLADDERTELLYCLKKLRIVLGDLDVTD